MLFSVVTSFVVAQPVLAASPPPNDDFAAAIAVDDGFSEQRDTAGATLEPAEPQPSCIDVGSTVWYRFAPEGAGTFRISTTNSKFDTVLGVYVGNSLTTLTEVACNDDFDDRMQARLDLVADAGDTYFIQVGGYQAATGLLRFSVERVGPAPVQPPDNDDFADARVVNELVNEASTAGATIEDGEPPSCPSSSGFLEATVWYRLTTTEVIGFIIDTVGSDFDTVLAVYSGDALDDLELRACNDDRGFGEFQSRVQVRARAGETLYIQIGGYADGSPFFPVGSGQGSLRLSIDPHPVPSNDDFANATEIPQVPFAADQSTVVAAVEDDEPTGACAPIGSTVWYSFTAGDLGSLVASTHGSGFDTVLAVYTGSAVDDLALVACNDDLGTGLQSMASFVTEPGETYHIQIGGYLGVQGDLSFRLSTGAGVEGVAGASIDGEEQHVAFGDPLLGASGEYHRGADGGEVEVCPFVLCASLATP